MLFKHNLYYGRFFSPDGGGGASGGTDGAAGDGDGDGQGGGAGDDAGDGDDLTGLRTALDKERSDRKAAQREIRTLKAQIAGTQRGGDDSAASLQDAVRRAETAEGHLRDANARLALTDAATKAGATNVKAVLRYLMSDVEFDDKGNPVDVDDLVKAAKAEVPQLFAPVRVPSGDGGKGGAAASEKDMNKALRQLAGATR